MVVVLCIVVIISTSIISIQAAPTVTTSGPPPIISSAATIAGGLLTQPSSNDRLKKYLADSSGNLLTGDALRQLTVFDFNNQELANDAQGRVHPPCHRRQFPHLAEPWYFWCNIYPSLSHADSAFHIHPRADEVLITVEGTLDIGFIMENGFNTEIETQLGKYQRTVFPMGSIHYQQNPTCEPAVFAAALNSADPGRSDITTYCNYDSAF